MANDMKTANWRSQIKAIIAGQKPDVVPASFRLDKWFQANLHKGKLPPELSGVDIDRLYSTLGLANPARNAKVFDIKLREPVNCHTSRSADTITTRWQTPKGTVKLVCRLTPEEEAAGLSPTILEHPIKEWDDYEIYRQILLHTEFIPNYEQYHKYEKIIGNSGLPLVILGPIPFHELLLRWTGYEKGYMDLFDCPDYILGVIDTAKDIYKKMWNIVADSPAEFVMHGVNFDTNLISPNIFREYFLNYCKEFNQMMHESGKYVAFHADGDMSGLLELVLEAGYDVADCFACKPMVKCTVEQAREKWLNDITIWGAVGSNQLEESYSLDELQRHLDNVYNVIKTGDRFILGIADQAMPGSDWQHIKMLIDTAHRNQNYPL